MLTSPDNKCRRLFDDGAAAPGPFTEITHLLDWVP
jgi:hypothetical protein